MKIKVTERKANFRKNSARAAYYERLRKYNNKTLEAYVKSCEKDVPSVPGKGKLKGKPEPIQGWISWFTREGYLELSE